MSELSIKTEVELIAVNSTGGISVSPLATRENLVHYIIQHQKTAHREATVVEIISPLMLLAGVGLGIVLVAAWFRSRK